MLSVYEKLEKCMTIGGGGGGGGINVGKLRDVIYGRRDAFKVLVDSAY